MKQRQNNVLFAAAAIVTFLMGASAIAQDYETEDLSPTSAVEEQKTNPDEKGKTATAPGKEKKLKIQFDNELVNGQQSMPEAEFIFSRAQFNYKKMIRLRENFIPEVEKGKDEFRGKH